ncbi:CsbD family protein [Novosphingobium colocasiae]
MGQLKDTVKGIANEVAGNVKQAAGRATNDPAKVGEGVAQERKGEVQQGVGKIKGGRSAIASDPARSSQTLWKGRLRAALFFVAYQFGMPAERRLAIW